MSYESKYLKYKNKYLHLKKIKGGSDTPNYFDENEQAAFSRYQDNEYVSDNDITEPMYQEEERQYANENLTEMFQPFSASESESENENSDNDAESNYVIDQHLPTLSESVDQQSNDEAFLSLKNATDIFQTDAVITPEAVNTVHQVLKYEFKEIDISEFHKTEDMICKKFVKDIAEKRLTENSQIKQVAEAITKLFNIEYNRWKLV